METEMRNYFSVLSLLFFSMAGADASLIQTEVSAGYTYDDNVTRAAWSYDIEKDSILNVDAAASYNITLNANSYFSLNGTLQVNQYLEFSKLSNTRIGLQGSYHIRPSAGYTATRYFVLAGLERRLYNSDQRDSLVTTIQLGLSKRLTDLITVRAGYIIDSIDAAESKGVFDSDSNRLYLDADYKLGTNNTLYLTVSRYDGDIVSTQSPITTTTTAAWRVVRDDAFLDLTPDMYAYKTGATSNTIRLGDNYSLADNQAVDASVLYYDTQSYVSYSGLILNLNYLYRF